LAVKNHKTCIDKHLRQRASWSPQTFGSAVPSQKLMRAEGEQMRKLINRLWTEDAGQDIAEYAVMLAVILVLVVGTVRLIGSNSNSVFSQAASSIQ
jgi:Flp pilus assembly pilin Flp